MDKVIWIINQYASHLETRHYELAKSFASQGGKVAVITSSFHHGKRQYLYDAKMKICDKGDNVQYFYLHSGPPYSNNGAKRFLNMIDFCRVFEKSQARIADATGKPDFIIASSAPPFVWESGYRSSKKYQAKFIAEFRDIWPQSLVDVQGLRPTHPVVKLLARIEKRAYVRADAIVSTMPYAWKHVTEVAAVPRDKVFWMPNGINVKEANNNLNSDLSLPQDLETYLSEHWCGVYVGSIVKSECLDFILRAIQNIDDPEIWFAIVGDGHKKESIMRYAEHLALGRVKFFPAVDKQLIPKVLQKAKVCLAAVEDLPIYQYGLSMNKLNDYLISGKPTVFACDADNVVKEAGHFAIPTKNESLMAKTIEKIKKLDAMELKSLSEKSVELIEKEYDYEIIGQNYFAMMERL